ncbi:hypothetical protein DPMN_103545 [Dreissena polymorpha]|uniref:Mitochondria-eating protein C-terminal domain-containing protein n=1 Tax=Dreissena polymorpha TaxID=45954 RepID=A0A9D4H893_DREPO|nr:hypothetical protein DPMN_103545 [Dreissena polymorpha]
MADGNVFNKEDSQLDIHLLKHESGRLFSTCKRIFHLYEQINQLQKKTKRSHNEIAKYDALRIEFEAEMNKSRESTSQLYKQIFNDVPHSEEIGGRLSESMTNEVNDGMKERLETELINMRRKKKELKEKLESQQQQIDKLTKDIEERAAYITTLEKEKNEHRDQNIVLRLDRRKDVQRMWSLRQHTTEKRLTKDTEERATYITTLKKEDDEHRSANRQCSMSMLRGLPENTRIDKQFKEIYENEWSDAFESIALNLRTACSVNNDNNVLFNQNNLLPKEDDIVNDLLTVLKTVYELCKEWAWDECFRFQIQSIKENPEMSAMVWKELLQNFLETRKQSAKTHLQDIALAMKSKVTLQNESKAMQSYVDKCFELCWLCVVQVPPLALNFDTGDRFDSSLFTEYTKRGPLIKFLAWPSLHIFENGPVVMKGFVETQEFESPSAVSEKDGHESSSQDSNDAQSSIHSLSRQDRITKVAINLTDLYETEWADALNCLDCRDSKETIKILLDILKDVYNHCKNLVNEKFFCHVQRAIELSAMIYMVDDQLDWSEYNVIISDEMKKEAERIRKLRAPDVFLLIANLNCHQLNLRK